MVFAVGNSFSTHSTPDVGCVCGNGRVFAQCGKSGLQRKPLRRVTVQRGDGIQVTWLNAFNQHRKRFSFHCEASSGSELSSDGLADRPPMLLSCLKAVWQFVKSQYLPLGLLLALLMGYIAPGPGVALADAGLSQKCTTVIFIISGLLLEKGEAAKAISAWGSVIFGTVSILLLTPLIAPLILKLPIQPPELVLGLAIFCLTPTTLSSGVALMQIVGGNVAMALLLTLVSNFLGVFTVPFSLPLVLGRATSGLISLSSRDLLIQLIQTVLLPALVGYSARALIPSLNKWVTNHRRKLSLLSSWLLVTVPWMQISKAVQNKVQIGPLALAATVAVGMLVHVGFLCINTVLVQGLKLGGDNPQDALAIQRAVILLASQKTLLISVTILAQLEGVLGGAAGIAMIPCVFSHLGQIVIDSALVSHWIGQDKLAKVR